MADDHIWQATEARAQLPAVMEAALSGKPQVIRKRSGEEVIVVSRADYNRMKPNLKDYLLRSASASSDDDEAFQAALQQVRESGTMGLAPRADKKRR